MMNNPYFNQLQQLPNQWQHYVKWLKKQDNPPKSYQDHPIDSLDELMALKKDFQKFVGISLGKYIRLSRVAYLLNQANHKFLTSLTIAKINTPLGEMLAVFSPKGLCLLEFFDRKMLESELLQLQKHFKANFKSQKTAISDRLQNELNEYFAHQRTTFSIPLDPIGTPFQQSVWALLQQIPYGKTHTYKQQAALLGKPEAIRAIASANGKNKISILIPCHRIIGSDGKLVGYGGGIERKKYLIDLEQQFHTQ